MSKSLDYLKVFVEKHKLSLGIIATASLALVLARMSNKQFNEFLKEKGLYDEYYNSID